MMRKMFALGLLAGALAADGAEVAAVLYATGLEKPTAITNASDGSGRLFVAEQSGAIRIIEGGQLRPTRFLDISARVFQSEEPCCDERGLLGLAFPPGFASRRRFYVNYTDRENYSVTSQFDLLPGSDAADPGSEKILLRLRWLNAIHNGGHLAFGPGGLLYLSLGDGGDAQTAQDSRSLQGKIVRIDVENDAISPVVWASGLRNPWRFSFDRRTGDAYIGDVGPSTFEEVNLAPAGAGGLNFGWPILEAFSCFEAPACDGRGLVPPVAAYTHESGCSITGGYVYRGSAIPDFDGTYVYGDFCAGTIWTLRPEGGAWQGVKLMETGFNISTFGEDEAGEIYLTDYLKGAIFRLTSSQARPGQN